MADAPPTGPAQVVKQLGELWGRQSRRRKTAAIAALFGVLAVVGWSMLGHRSDNWAVVAETASPDDAQELLVTLQTRNVPARLHDGKVEVAPDRIDEARAVAASAGLPHTGKGFELFDGSSLGQSSFAEQVNYRRALQGELARSIAAMAQVESARVHLALGKRSVFKDQDEAASASVALHLHPGQTLSAEQVRGVRQLVAASVEGLKPEAVVIVDNHGNLLDGADPNAVDRKAELERTVTGRVRNMLERVVGMGKVSVVTTADVDERKVSETQEVFDADHPALRSESRTLEGANAIAGIGGIAGTRGNLPGAPAAGPTGPGGGSNERLQETKNYEVSRTVRQTSKPDVQLTKLHLAVVVDYKTGADGKPLARTDKELAELTALARQAGGIDDARGDKIEVRAIPFAGDTEAAAAAASAPTAAELPLIPVAIGAGAVLFLAIVAFAVMRKKRKQREDATRPLALPAPIGDIERVLDERPSLELPPEIAPPVPRLTGPTVRDRVLEAVRGDAERAAEILTSWLAEPPARKGAKS